MSLRIVPYTEAERTSALAFNDRMRAANAPTGFLLPEEPPEPPPTSRAIRPVYHVAVDGDAVRGGLVAADCPAVLQDEVIVAVNCIAPLSEGIVDRKYAGVAPQFLWQLTRRCPYVFSVGMGSPENPYPRLLRASGWTLLNVPFFFRILRPARVLRQLPVLRRTLLRRAAASLTAASGLGALAIAARQWRSRSVAGSAAGLAAETPAGWEEEWTDPIWRDFARACSFSVARDARTLRDLYPPDDPLLLRFLLRRNGRPVAWASALNTKMRGNPYFGDLQVATILDCLGEPAELTPAVARVAAELRASGADLVIANQMHAELRVAFLRAGFQPGPSNYQLGLSKPLAQKIRDGRGDDRVHLTRGDGDGRMHL